MTKLLDNVNVNTTSDPVEFTGGSKVAVVRGDDFGGGTVNIEQKSTSDPSERFATVASFTSNGTKILESMKSGMSTRADLTGATNPVNVFVELV